MIFDEIDTGVSGIAAQRVGEKLFSVSLGKQVMCVTHLPQIAAMADNHYLIRKEERGGRTYTDVLPLDLEGRKQELARCTAVTTSPRRPLPAPKNSCAHVKNSSRKESNTRLDIGVKLQYNPKCSTL